MRLIFGGITLEPHHATKRVEHFATEVTSGDVIVSNYYPHMAAWGFGTLLRMPVEVEEPKFIAEINTNFADEWRFFSRKNMDEMTDPSLMIFYFPKWLSENNKHYFNWIFSKT